MERLEKLTPAQEELMIKIKNEWLDYIFSCKNSINKEQADKQIDWLYQFCGLEKPIKIYVDSPMSCQIAVLYVKEYAKILSLNSSQVDSQVYSQVESQVRSQVYSQVYSQVESQVYSQVLSQARSQVRSQVGSQVGSQVRPQVRSQVWSQVRPQVRSQVGSQVGSQVRPQVESQVGSQEITPENFASYGSIWDYGWVSFYDFFTQCNIINNNNFNEFKSLLRSGIYDMIQLNGFCIVSQLPNKIKRSGELLHSLDNYAIEFKDGYGQNYINGRFIPEKYFNSIKNNTFTITDFINEENEEFKSTCIAMIQELKGDEGIVNFFRESLNEVDTYVDKKEEKYLQGTTGGMNIGVYTLFKGEINNEKIAYVRCYCPSTDRMFFLGVDDVHNNAKDAIASLYRIPFKLKKHIKSISRQGERFSTILTEEGNNVLNSMTKEEIEDNTYLSGSDYFKLMQYEY